MSVDVRTAGLTAVLTFRAVSTLQNTGDDKFMKGLVVDRARHPDLKSEFNTRTQHLRNAFADTEAGNNELFNRLISGGYDGLIFFEGRMAVGYLFWQKCGSCFNMFSLEVVKELRGRHYAERLVKEFLLYIDELTNHTHWLAYIGEGNNPAVRRICQKVENNELGLPFETGPGIKDTPGSVKPINRAA
jgi:hypothetical protein